MSEIKLKFLGAAESVTGTCTLVTCGKTTLLVDCGVIQNGQKENELNYKPFSFDVHGLNAVIMTHGHMDHTGRMPLLVSQGFTGEIIAHPASAELASLIWFDSVRIHNSGSEPLYNENAVNNTIAKIRTVQYENEIEINDVKLTFFDAGHILGSSHVLINYKGKRVIFSGDIGIRQTPIIRDPYVKWTENVHGVVIESTYGNRIHKGRDQTIEEFKEIVRRTISEKGIIIIPAFAIGRTQEILYHLNTLVEHKHIPVIPVFVDSPMANRVTQIYRKYTDCYDSVAAMQIFTGDMPLEFRGLNSVMSSSDSKSIKNTLPPYIIIAGSGMCNGGRVVSHLQNNLNNKKTTVMFVGYQGYGTTGRSLVDGEGSVFIGGEYCDVAARIETLNGFSAHADKQELIDWAKAVKGNDIKWFVNHGEKAASEALASELVKANCGTAEVAKMGMEVVI